MVVDYLSRHVGRPAPCWVRLWFLVLTLNLGLGTDEAQSSCVSPRTMTTSFVQKSSRRSMGFIEDDDQSDDVETLLLQQARDLEDEPEVHAPRAPEPGEAPAASATRQMSSDASKVTHPDAPEPDTGQGAVRQVLLQSNELVYRTRAPLITAAVLVVTLVLMGLILITTCVWSDEYREQFVAQARHENMPMTRTMSWTSSLMTPGPSATIATAPGTRSLRLQKYEGSRESTDMQGPTFVDLRQETAAVGVKVPQGAPSDSSKRSTPAFCPSLIVPEGHECHLVVPIRGGSPLSHGPFSISDVNDNTIFTVEPKVGSRATFGRARQITDWISSEQLLIRGATSGQLLLRCMPAMSRHGGTNSYLPDGLPYPKVFHIMQGDGDACARLECGVADARCELYTANGSRKVTYHGDFTQNMLAVLDDEDVIIATTGRCNAPFDATQTECYTVRAAQNVDVGIILGGLLCIDWWTAMAAAAGG